MRLTKIVAILALITLGMACGKKDTPTPTSSTKNGTVVLKNLTLIDGTGAAPTTTSISIQNGVIKEIGTQITYPTNVKVIDLTGQYAIPGLIDGHGHLTDSEDTEAAKASLKQFFASGVTTVRDMAGNGTALKKVTEWAKDVTIPAGLVYYSAMVAGPTFLANDPRVIGTAGNSTPGEVAWLPRLDNNTNIPDLVSNAKAFGVTALKLYADISAPLAIAVTQEAQRQGLKVWAHSTLYTATADDLLTAGVDVMSHASDLKSIGQAGVTAQQVFMSGDPTVPLSVNSSQVITFLNDMRDKGIILDATLAVVAVRFPNEADYANKITKKANELGVLIGAGTDLDATIQGEVKLLVTKAGLTTMEGIQAATINNAKAIGIDDKYGTIEVDKIGDIVILGADPISNIDNLNQVSYTIKAGRVFKCTGGNCTIQ